MSSSSDFSRFLVLIAVCILISTINAAIFNITFDVTPNLTQSITSGHRALNGVITIPDLFIKHISTKRRLKEIAPQPTVSTTPAPTTKLILPVITLIHPEGAHDRSLSITGSQFDLNEAYEAHIFDDLKDRLVSDGKMAVIQYDKRNCVYPHCDSLCPNLCPDYVNTCNAVAECYNDTNITLSDLVHDAKRVFINGITQIKPYLNEQIVDFNNIWRVPIGFSFQGASIATYIASKYGTHAHSSSRPTKPTAISLMGCGVSIDELLMNQLRVRMHKRNNSDMHSINEAIRTLKHKFECIQNGTLEERDMVHIENDFLFETKHVKYWKDWLDITQDIEYDDIFNFMAINSGSDQQVTPTLFEPLKAKFEGNVSMDIHIMQHINHYMINTKDFKQGNWKVDDKITQHIISFLNDNSGYLDAIHEWMLLNHTNDTMWTEEEPIENDTVYKVLLYIAIMAIVCILACGIYFITANKVCPYELEEDRGSDINQEEERERRRRRRRRHRRERRRSSHRNNRNMIELNEPMIQSLLQPLTHEHNQENQNNDNNNGNNNSNDSLQIQPQEQNSILNEYVD